MHASRTIRAKRAAVAATSQDGPCSSQPTGDDTKAVISAWLDAAGVNVPAKATKRQLLDLVAGNC